MDEIEVAFSWASAPANKETFKIKPIKELVERYVGDGIGWADPFARNSHLCEFTNDINPKTEAEQHMDALDFVNWLARDQLAHPTLMQILRGAVLDPPYSYRQVSEHYKAHGYEVTALDTSFNFYNRVMTALAPMVEIGGRVISCGWNSNGFGKKKGFAPLELLVVRHGLHHNDTIVLVEQRVA